MNATDEEQHRAIGRQVERLAGPAAIAGGEEGVLDAGAMISIFPAGWPYSRRNCRSSSVQLTQIASAHPMISASARSRHSGSKSPPSALTLARVWKVLTNGTIELVLDAVGDEPAEPVVGVQDVGRRIVLDVVDHGVAELVEHRRQLLLGQVVRAGGNVHHPVTRLDLDDLREPGPRRPRVGGAVDTGLGESGNQLAHVDVHAATVAGARLGERRCVE